MRQRRLRRAFVALLTAGGLTATALTAAGAAQAASGCQVTYKVGSQWGGGFIAEVALTNLGDPLSGWTLRWTFGAGQSVTSAWNATLTQSGSTVSAANASWNAGLATGATTSFGFQGSWNASSNPVPPAFALNGVGCTGSTTGGTTSSTTGTRPTTTRATTTTTRPTTTTGRTTGTTTRATTTSTGSSGTPPTGTVRVFWLKPSDVGYDQRYPDGIASVMREAQQYYQQEFGRTFTLNDPVVEVVNGDQPRSYYENTPNCGEKYWWAVCNMQTELIRRFGLQAPDSRWLNVGEVSAEGDGAGGGGGNGWVILSGHDADGGAGLNGSMNRWYGGMVHELGHALGLPDSSSTDGTPMSASFYNYPNTHFSQAQKDAILSGRYGSFLK
jgi:hypothetical protein